jgi:hypothetical protein
VLFNESGRVALIRRDRGEIVVSRMNAKITGAGLLLALLNGCTTVAQVTTLAEESCHRAMQDQLESILTEEHEPSEVANRLAVNTTTVLATGALGPRPFGISSPSGADYSFFIQRKGDECLLRLYGRQKGFTRYRNNLTYLATRSLQGCACAE